MAIKFRQKLYFWGAALGIAVPSALQVAGNKAAEEQGEQQMEEMRRHNAAMEKAAKANPALAAGVERSFAAPGSLMANAQAFGKDLWNLARTKEAAKLAGKSVAMGTGFGLMGYGANKVIQGAEALDKEKTYAFTPMKVNMETLKKGASYMGKEIGGQFKGAGLFLGAGIPIAGYAAGKIGEKSAQKNMTPQPQETTYSVMSAIKAAPGMIKKGWGAFKKDPVTSIVKPTTDMFGFGFGGHTAAQNLGNTLKNGSESQWGKNIGEWITKRDPKTGKLVNGNKMAIATLIPGSMIASKTMGIGEKAVEAPARKLDPGAYKYQDQQNQEI